jgi:hypothetical protein
MRFMPSVTKVLQKVPFSKRIILTLGCLTLINDGAVQICSPMIIFTSFEYTLTMNIPVSVLEPYISSRK